MVLTGFDYLPQTLICGKIDTKESHIGKFTSPIMEKNPQQIPQYLFIEPCFWPKL